VRELSGRPAVALHGRAQAIAENLGLTQWALSLSHSFPDFWLLLHVAAGGSASGRRRSIT